MHILICKRSRAKHVSISREENQKWKHWPARNYGASVGAVSRRRPTQRNSRLRLVPCVGFALFHADTLIRIRAGWHEQWRACAVTPILEWWRVWACWRGGAAVAEDEAVEHTSAVLCSGRLFSLARPWCWVPCRRQPSGPSGPSNPLSFSRSLLRSPECSPSIVSIFLQDSFSRIRHLLLHKSGILAAVLVVLTTLGS